MLHVLAEHGPRRARIGPDRHRPRHRLRRRRHRPRHRHRPRRGQRDHGDGSPARVGRHGAHDDVLGHRVHRGPRSVRLRPRVHHLGLEEASVRTRKLRHRHPHRGTRCLRCSPVRRRRPSRTRVEPRARRRRSASRSWRPAARSTTAKGAEPDQAREQRADLGRHLVRRAALPHVEVRLSGHQEGHAGPYRPHPQERRGRRQRQGASRDRARGVPRPARGREERVGPHRRRGTPAGRRAQARA